MTLYRSGCYQPKRQLLSAHPQGKRAFPRRTEKCRLIWLRSAHQLSGGTTRRSDLARVLDLGAPSAECLAVHRGGDEDQYLWIVQASFAVSERLIPVQFLESIAGETAFSDNWDGSQDGGFRLFAAVTLGICGRAGRQAP